ncbi:hypothetical protein KDL21_24315 [Pseudomonas syringae pv. syringae]|uniref:hypothetical protein n=1 Tax=Pseudomonas syringae TaxID=317 RepID=UPI0011C37534|nr:hypothetical protein [Pseudomonas syringae]MDC3744152.1 hypothetical protein [Pseudomonas syringae pv. syringae]
MQFMNGFRRLLVIASVIAGFSTLVYLSDAFMSPTQTVNSVYEGDVARLQSTIIQLKTQPHRSDAVAQAEKQIGERRVEFVKQIQSLPTIVFATFLVCVFASVLVGIITFLAGFAIEWAYRGFRPLPSDESQRS